MDETINKNNINMMFVMLYNMYKKIYVKNHNVILYFWIDKDL